MDKGNESGQNRAQTRTLSKSRAQNFNKKLGQGSTPSLPTLKCAPVIKDIIQLTFNYCVIVHELLLLLFFFLNLT